MAVVSITREQLHRIVWLKPMAELVLELGVSNQRLVEICNLLNVPYPRHLYWRRLRAGEHVVRFELPKMTLDAPAQVTLRSEPWAQRALDLARTSDVCEGQALETEVLPNLHPIIRGWHREKLRHQATSDRKSSCWSACELRKHRILDRIFRAVEEKGYSVASDWRRNAFTLSRETIRLHFRLHEHRLRIVKHGTFGASHDLKPSGKLHFVFRGYHGSDSPRRCNWRDTETQDLEALTPNIISTLLAAGEALTLHRLREIQLDRARNEAERLRREEETRRQTDQKLWTSFIALADRADVANRIRRFLSMLENSSENFSTLIQGRSVLEWLSWANDHLAQFESNSHSPTRVFAELAGNLEAENRDR
jgi:hypothetical protein